MKKILIRRNAARSLVLTLLLALTSCTLGESRPPRSAEELRLERCCRVDSTSLLAVVNPDSIEGSEQLDALTAEAWILVDDSTGMLISARNATERMFPASLTKMMTCLLSLENGCLSDSIDITDGDFVTRDSRVRPGEGYVMYDLLSEMMLQSDNVAACALARHVGGDTLSFCEMMNAKAAYLGMDSTHFANPNGMPNDSNYSSARDLLFLTRYSMADSLFAQMVSTVEADIPLLDGRHLTCRNTNLLLDRYEGCIGVKTGYTRKAGSCLASAVTRDGVTLVLVLLKSRTRSLRFSESETLFDYGFRVMQAYRENANDYQK